MSANLFELNFSSCIIFFSPNSFILHIHQYITETYEKYVRQNLRRASESYLYAERQFWAKDFSNKFSPNLLDSGS